MKDFEELKQQMLKINDQEQKVQKKPKEKEDSKGDEKPEIQSLIEMFHVCDFFNDGMIQQFLEHNQAETTEGKQTLVNSEEDIHAILQVANNIGKRNVSISIAIGHAEKFITSSDDDAHNGRTYNLIRQQLLEVISSPLFANPQTPSPKNEEQSNSHEGSPVSLDAVVGTEGLENETVIKDESEEVKQKEQNKQGFKREKQTRSERGKNSQGNHTEGRVNHKDNRRGRTGNQRPAASKVVQQE